MFDFFQGKRAPTRCSHCPGQAVLTITLLQENASKNYCSSCWTALLIYGGIQLSMTVTNRLTSFVESSKGQGKQAEDAPLAKDLMRTLDSDRAYA